MHCSKEHQQPAAKEKIGQNFQSNTNIISQNRKCANLWITRESDYAISYYKTPYHLHEETL